MGPSRLQFGFSKKGTKIWRNPTWFEFYLGNVKSTERFRQIFVALLENLNIKAEFTAKIKISLA